MGFYCPGATGQDIMANYHYSATILDPCPTVQLPGGMAYSRLCSCPSGYFTPSDALVDIDECLSCPEGFYCGAGSSSPSGPCAKGHYCPRGTSFATQFPCAAGSYTASTNLPSQEYCTDCPKGSYCITGSIAPHPCPAGTYTNSTRTPGLDECRICPEGYICPIAGTVQPTICDKGTYSGPGALECIECPVGKYCPHPGVSEDQVDSGNIDCPAGMYCVAGTGLYPELTNHKCPKGKYCPTGTPLPIDCPAGTYNPLFAGKTLADCIVCPAGYYCEEGSKEPTGLCAPGYFCPAGSTVANTTPCPVKTYMAYEGAKDVSDCALCPSGQLCPSPGTVTFSPCPVGNYCPPGSSSPIPCPVGTYRDAEGARTSKECISCPPGKYCNTPGSISYTGNCNAGYYCVGGSDTPAPAPPGDPTSAVPLPIGGRCPAGGFCPIGSSQPQPCPSGTFSSTPGRESADDCIPCLPGMYCQGSSSPYPTGPCYAGFYCTSGSSSPTQKLTPAGSYTLEGDSAPRLCPPGSYQSDSGQSSCAPCSAGRLCDRAGTVIPDICPAGHYCLEGSNIPFPCAVGTFLATPGGLQAEDCELCPPGKFCSATGLDAVSGDCDAGYYCIGGSPFSNPGADGFITNNPFEMHFPYGGVCPAGHYCPLATENPVPCPLGTFSTTLGATSIGACQACTAGSYCGDVGLTEPTGLCQAGFYCNAGSSIPNPTPCTIGHYCPVGTAVPYTCPPGTYSVTPNLSECTPCPETFYCDGTNPTTPITCIVGHYCPEGTDLPNPCPPGTFTSTPGRGTVNTCTPCSAGRACTIPGLTAPDKNCSAGHYCSSGALDVLGRRNVDDEPSLCPAGHYCPEGVTLATPCPIGTINPGVGATSADACKFCPEGSYCGTQGLAEPTGLCRAGYYCRRANSHNNPTIGVVQDTEETEAGTVTIYKGGNVCPIGHYCPAGTITPVPCEEGTYNPNPGEGVACLTCPGGYWCGPGTVDYNLTPCGLGIYCPPGTGTSTGVLCPQGTMGTVLAATHENDCTPCTPGYACMESGISAPSKQCAAGYACFGRAATPNPMDGVTGRACVLGELCPAGTGTPTMCPAGKYCEDPMAGAPTGPCDPGHYCVQGSWLRNPVGETNAWGPVGNLCSAGTWCGEGSSAATKCPIGTYSSEPGATSPNACLPCTAGFVCNVEGLDRPTILCPAGYRCPEGTSAATSICPAGTYCPLGSSSAELCPAGSYSPNPGSSACLPCPAGKFCPNAGTSVPSNCQPGYYCPGSSVTGSENPCPIGTYNSNSQASSLLQCLSCPPGKACTIEATTTPESCAAGHYCIGRTRTRTPVAINQDPNGPLIYTCPVPYAASPPSDASSLVLAARGDICPAGHYCPEGASSPLACPPGTFVTETGSTALSACKPCTPGYACPSSGTAIPTVLCPPGYVCTGGNVSGNEQLATPGHYAPTGSLSQLPCQPGTYSDAFGLSACKQCTAGYFCLAEATGPTICPPGRYCPPGTGNPDDYLCPVGTYSSSTGLSSVGECNACTAGEYCDAEGLTVTAGPCDAGYICYQGSTVPNPDDGVMGDLCYPGHYCSGGNASGTPCPPGTFSDTEGNIAVTDCQSCTPGYICPDYGTLTPVQTCPPGFYCPGGDIYGTNICPLGSYCPGGNPAPIPCTAGTYSGTVAAHECTSCPAGRYCPPGTSSPTNCPLGYYCPGGSATGFENPCPIGTYSDAVALQSVGSCKQCIPGFFCGEPGLTEPSGPCGPGYYCSEGASVPMPTDGITGGPCHAGFVCGLGSWTPEPPQIVPPNTSGWTLDKGFPCNPGNSCPAGTTVEIACPGGTYQPSMGQASCVTCPAGYVCPGNTAIPADCPVGGYCPTGSEAATPCPNGYYGQTSRLTSANQCSMCESGRYCTGGVISGLCAAGYLCITGIPKPDPESEDGILPTHGGPCPIGYYCPEGSSVPTACPPGFFSAILRATSELDCGPCPPGYTCTVGSPVPIPCAEGGYCPSNGERFECPVFTYNPNTASSSIAACIPCPAGYFCNGEGITSQLGTYACPVGHYCPYNTRPTPLPCPAGTYSDITGAASPEDCFICPGGFKCPEGSIIPASCPSKVYCPEGAPEPHTCPARYYCPPQTEFPIICPAGAYCPPGTESPIQCPMGTYCEEGSEYPTTCPPGTYANHDTSSTSRNSFEEACTYCPPGYYSTGEDGLVCHLCTAGYVCEGGTTSSHPLNRDAEKGFICPLGHYCPAGSAAALPCPVGYFNGLLGATTEDRCMPCVVGTYANLEGSGHCRPCSSSSFTNSTASTTCICRGLYRSFSPSDGFCICSPGYAFLDNLGNELSEADGEEDCAPIPLSRCSGNKRRLPNGTCQEVDCSLPHHCLSGRGEWSDSLGMCQCLGNPEVDDICDEGCRDALPSLGVDPVTGGFVYTDPDLGEQTSFNPVRTVQGFVGTLECLTHAQQLALLSGAFTSTTPSSVRPGSAALSTAWGGLFSSTGAAVVPAAAMGDTCPVTTLYLDSHHGFVGIFEPPSSFVTEGLNGARRRRLGGKGPVAGARAYTWNTTVGTYSWHHVDVETVDYSEEALWNSTFDEEAPYSHPDTALHIQVTDIFPNPDDGISNPALTLSKTHLGRPSYRQLQTVPPTPPPGPYISAPIVCLPLGGTLLFDLPEGKTTYPIYLKNSLLNTNPDFDYGNFRHLASLAANEDSEIRYFAYSFAQNGTYAFTTSNNPQRGATLVVVVMAAGLECPVETSLVPVSYDNLVLLGLRRSEIPALVPDWSTIAGMLIGLFLFLIVLMACILTLRRLAFGDTSYRKGRVIMQQSFLDRMCLRFCGRCARAIGLIKQSGKYTAAVTPFAHDPTDPLSGIPGSYQDEDLAALVQRVKRYQEETVENFENQKKATDRLIDALRSEAEALRKILANNTVTTAAAGLVAGALPVEAAGHSKRAVAIRQMETEMALRTLFDRLNSEREESIWEALLALKNMLDSTPKNVAEATVEETFSAVVQAWSDGEKEGGSGIERAQAVHPSIASGTSEEIRALCMHIQELIGACIADFEQERSRRKEALGLWAAASSANLINSRGEPATDNKEDNALVKSLEILEKYQDPLNESLKAYYHELEQFSNGVGKFLPVQHTCVGTLIAGLVQGMDQKNRDTIDSTKTTSQKILDALLSQLQTALHALLGLIPKHRDEVLYTRQHVSGVADDVSERLRKLRKISEEEADLARITAHGAAGTLGQLNAMLESARKGVFAVGGDQPAPVLEVPLQFMNQFSGHQALEPIQIAGAPMPFALQAFEIMLPTTGPEVIAGADEEAIGVDAAAEVTENDAKAAALIVAQVENQLQAEQAETISAISAVQEAMEMDEMKEFVAKKEEEVRRIRNNTALTEEQKARLIRELEEDQAALALALQNEKARQAAELKKKFDERRAAMLARRAKRAADKLASDTEARNADRLAKKQDEQRQRLMDVISAEEEEARRNLDYDLELKEDDDSNKAGLPISSIGFKVATEDIEALAHDRLVVHDQALTLREKMEQKVAPQTAKIDAERVRQLNGLESRAKARREGGLESFQRQHLEAATSAKTFAEKAIVAKNKLRDLEALRSSVETDDSKDGSAVHELLLSANNMTMKAMESELSELLDTITRALTQLDAERMQRSNAITSLVSDRRKTVDGDVEAHAQTNTPGAAKHVVVAEIAKAQSTLDIVEAKTLAFLEARVSGVRSSLETLQAEARLLLTRLPQEHNVLDLNSELGLQRTLEAIRVARDLLLGRAVAEASLTADHAAEEARTAEKAVFGIADPMMAEQAQKDAINKLKERQQLEIDALAASLDERAREAEKKAREDEDRRNEMLAQKVKDVRARYEREAEALAASLDAEKARQMAEMNRRLQERKAARERAAKNRAQAQLAALTGSGGDVESVQQAMQQAQDAVAAAEQEAAQCAVETAKISQGLTRAVLDAETELARVHAEAQAEYESLEAAIMTEKARQEAELQKKLAARRAEADKRRAQQQAAALLASERAKREGTTAALKEEARQLALLDEIDAETRQELEHIEEEGRKEREAIEQQAKNASVAEQMRFQSKILDAEETLARLRAEHEEQLAERMNALSSEKRRQQAMLEEKLRHRREAKMRQLMAKQATELHLEARHVPPEELAALTGVEDIDSASEGASVSERAFSSQKPTIDEDVMNVAESIVATEEIVNKVQAQLLSPKFGKTGRYIQVDNDEEARKRLEMVEEDAKKRLEELERKQEQERLEALQKEQEEQRMASERQIREAEEARRAAIEAKRKEAELRIQQASENSADEAARVRAEYEKEIAALESSLESEKARQTARLQAQLEARKQRKARELARKQQFEKEAEMAKIAAEKAEAEAAEAVRKELEVLQQVMTEKKGNSQPSNANTTEAIEMVLSTRHTRETSDLLARQYAERSRALRLALEAILDRQNEEKEQLLSEIPEGTSSEEVDVRLHLLKKKYDAERTKAEKEALETLEVTHAAQQLALRQRQLTEISNAYSQLAPEEVLLRAEAKAAADEAEQLAAFQKKLAQDREDRIAKIKAEQERVQRELEEAAKEEEARLEAEHAALLAAETAKAEAALRLRRDRLAAETEAARKRRLEESSALDDATRERVMREFDEERAAVERKLDAVRAAQQAKLQQRLSERREKARLAAEAKHAENLRLAREKAEAEAAEARRQATETAREQEARKEAERTAAAASAQASLSASGSKLGGAVTRTAERAVNIQAQKQRQTALGEPLGSPGTAMGLLQGGFLRGGKPGFGSMSPEEMSELEKRLEVVESMLAQLAQRDPTVTGGKGVSSKESAPSTTIASPGFVKKTSTPTPHLPAYPTKVYPSIPDKQLTPQELTTVHFARRILSLLGLRSEDPDSSMPLFANVSVIGSFDESQQRLDELVCFTRAHVELIGEDGVGDMPMEVTLQIPRTFFQAEENLPLLIVQAAAHIRSAAQKAAKPGPSTAVPFVLTLNAFTQAWNQTHDKCDDYLRELTDCLNTVGNELLRAQAPLIKQNLLIPTPGSGDLSGIDAGSASNTGEHSPAGQRKSVVSFLSPVGAAPSRPSLAGLARAFTSVRNLRLSTRNLESALNAVEAPLPEKVPDVQPSIPIPSLNKVAAGSLAEKLLTVPTFAHRNSLQDYLTKLESAVVEDEAPVSPKNTLTESTSSELELPAQESGATGKNHLVAYRTNLETTIAYIADAVDKSDALYLERVEMCDEAEDALFELETWLEEKKATLKKVKRQEKRDRELQGLPPLLEEEDEDEDGDGEDDVDFYNEESEIDFSSPTRVQAEADLRQAQERVAEARKHLDSCENMVNVVSERISKLNAQLEEKKLELAKLDAQVN